MGRLAGRVALVTGAGQGIGRGIALVFAREGAKVVVAELKAHRGERTAEEIRTAGGEARAVVADVGSKTDIERMVEETVRASGPLRKDMKPLAASSDAPFFSSTASCRIGV